MNSAPSLAEAVPIFTTELASARLKVFRSIGDLPESIQVRFFGSHWKDHRFLRLVERTLNEEVEHCCLCLEDLQQNALLVQPALIIRQDLAVGIGGPLRRLIAFVRKYWKTFLRPRMLMIGCLAGEGTWPLESNLKSATELFAEGINRFAEQRGIRFITFKELPAHARPSFATLATHQFARVSTYPAVKLELIFHSFDEYLQTLSKPTRKNLRRKFRESAERASLTLEVSAAPAPETIDEIYALYQQVYERSEVRFEKLTRDYFASVATELSDRAHFFLWRICDRLVAFNLCFVHDGIIYDDYLGLDYEVAHHLHLYFVTFRDIFQWALSNGLRTYYSTPLSYEPKLHLRFSLVPLDLYLRHTNSWLNPLYQRAARTMGPIANDPLLERFPNSQELLS